MTRFRWIGTLLLAAAVVAGAFLVRRPQGAGVTVRLGEETTVFDYSSQACDRLDIPDTPARAFRDASGAVTLLASHHVTRRATGPGLDDLTRDCAVVMSSHEDPRPERFDDREWIAATWTPDGRNVAALVHNEYQGHRHPSRCPSGVYRRCWYNSITLATSADGGRTFRHAEPPGHLVAALPSRYRPDAGPEGAFSASNIVPGRDDGFLYALFQLESEEHGTGSCLMRTRDPFDAGSWRAWDGEAFRVSFPNPYGEGEAGRFCEPVSPDRISTMRQSLTFNTYLDRYLLLGVATAWNPRERRQVPGIYLSTSHNLIDWSERRLVLEGELPWTWECGDEAPVNYPSLLDPASPSRNFDTTSESGYLYFTRLNRPGCRRGLDRDLVRVPVTLERPS